MGIITRRDKGSALSHNELDNNFKICENLKGNDVPTELDGVDGDHYSKTYNIEAIDPNEITFNLVYSNNDHIGLDCFPYYGENFGTIENDENDAWWGMSIMDLGLIWPEKYSVGTYGLEIILYEEYASFLDYKNDTIFWEKSPNNIQILGVDFEMNEESYCSTNSSFVFADPMFGTLVEAGQDAQIVIDTSFLLEHKRKDYVKDNNIWIEVPFGGLKETDSGYSLTGKNPINYGIVGPGSTDLSYSDEPQNNLPLIVPGKSIGSIASIDEITDAVEAADRIPDNDLNFDESYKEVDVIFNFQAESKSALVKIPYFNPLVDHETFVVGLDNSPAVDISVIPLIKTSDGKYNYFITNYSDISVFEYIFDAAGINDGAFDIYLTGDSNESEILETNLEDTAIYFLITKLGELPGTVNITFRYSNDN